MIKHAWSKIILPLQLSFSHTWERCPSFSRLCPGQEKKSTNATRDLLTHHQGTILLMYIFVDSSEGVRQNMWDFGEKINILGGKTKALLMTTQMHAYHWTLLSLWAMCYVHLPTRPTSEPTMFSNLFILCHY